jgi:hypothetical protein
MHRQEIRLEMRLKEGKSMNSIHTMIWMRAESKQGETKKPLLPSAVRENE